MLKPSEAQAHDTVGLKEGNRTAAHRAIIKSSSSGLTAAKLTKKSRSKPLSVERGGENLVKEIQAMIVSQEIYVRTRPSLALLVVSGTPQDFSLTRSLMNRRQLRSVSSASLTFQSPTTCTKASCKATRCANKRTRRTCHLFSIILRPHAASIGAKRSIQNTMKTSN